MIRTGGAEHTLGATYRLQLSPQFGFRSAAARQLDYLALLGITDVYSSPMLAAAHGSTHGYDVVDHRRINPELGGERGLRRLDLRSSRERASACCWTGSPTTWASAAGRTAGGTTCWRTARAPLSPTTSTSTGRRRNTDWPIACFCRSWASQYGEVLESGELKLIWDDGASASPTSTTVSGRAEDAVPVLESVVLALEIGRGRPDARSWRASSPRCDTCPSGARPRRRRGVSARARRR